MSEIIKKVLTEEELAELNSQLEPDETLQFMFVSNCTPIEKDKGERFHCKNGHFNFISNYMGFQPNTIVDIKCSECDEIIFGFKPFATRIRKLIVNVEI